MRLLNAPSIQANGQIKSEVETKPWDRKMGFASSEFFGLEPPPFSVWEDIPPSFCLKDIVSMLKLPCPSWERFSFNTR